MEIRVLDILEETMADGPGLRISIYCAGCKHHCPGCHNPQSWDMNGGRPMDTDDILKIILDDEFSNVTFTGGDPSIEEIRADERLSMMLPYLDVVVDGPFIMEKRDTELLFRGSSNQRIIYLNGKEEDIIPGTVKTIPVK